MNYIKTLNTEPRAEANTYLYVASMADDGKATFTSKKDNAVMFMDDETQAALDRLHEVYGKVFMSEIA